MSTEPTQILVSGLTVDVVRKSIKNLHLGVYPPAGRVRVAAPLTISDEAVRLAIVTRLSWIKRRRSNFQAQERQSKRDYVSGESHYFQGRRYRLLVTSGQPKVRARNGASIEMLAPEGSDRSLRERILQNWYRRELRKRADPIVQRWVAKMELDIPRWGIRRMKTKWGSCSPATNRFWINLELVKKPPDCLEYIIVHELVHFVERRHSERFQALMQRYLPRWQLVKAELNAAPLAHEDWSY